MNQHLQDITLLRDLIERWAVSRDALLWDQFRTVWHPDGRMKATWFDGPFEEFIRITEQGSRHGLNILHTLGGSAIQVNGRRATSLTRVVITQRAAVEGILCDVTVHARHQDLWEKRRGRWGLVSRETICDKDRLDPLDPRQTLNLEAALLDQFPVEYRHLAYLQTQAGYTVDRDVPRPGSPALQALYRRAREWLAGS
jgi:hypothetical protein